jgi:glycosyltransferase involved in cell wall biosynthesis
MPTPQLTAVVPTRDRPQLAADCVAGLRAQAGVELQVLVVDDGSHPPFRVAAGADCVRQEPAGLNAARNAGLEQARAPLVAFLDDDVIVRPGWAEGIVRAFAAGADAVGGRVLLDLARPAPRWLTPALRGYLSEYDRGPSPAWVADAPLPFGANCAVRRERALELGGFRADLDRVGSSLISNGERELFLRLQAAGGRIRYAPDAVVVHRIGPERMTIAHLRRRAFAQGISDRLAPDPADQRGVGRRLTASLRLPARLARGLATGAGGVEALLWIEYWRGRLASP